MAPKRRVTREMIVETARRIVAEQGTGALTFQVLASALGVSKQAIIYWYPSKRELVRDFCLPVLREETEALIAALAGTRTGAEAVEAYVRAVARFHLADLGRFRMLYLWVQFEPELAVASAADSELLRPIHETTGSAYDVLEAKIAGDAAFVGEGNARELAVAADMAAIGLVTMIAMADAMNDPWKQPPEVLLDALVALLTGKHRSPVVAPGPARRGGG